MAESSLFSIHTARHSGAGAAATSEIHFYSLTSAVRMLKYGKIFVINLLPKLKRVEKSLPAFLRSEFMVDLTVKNSKCVNNKFNCTSVKSIYFHRFWICNRHAGWRWLKHENGPEYRLTQENVKPDYWKCLKQVVAKWQKATRRRIN